MTNRTYTKGSNAGQLISELLDAGLRTVMPLGFRGLQLLSEDPTSRRQFYGATANPQDNPTETIVHCTDDLTEDEAAIIDTVVQAHVPA